MRGRDLLIGQGAERVEGQAGDVRVQHGSPDPGRVHGRQPGREVVGRRVGVACRGGADGNGSSQPHMAPAHALVTTVSPIIQTSAPMRSFHSTCMRRSPHAAGSRLVQRSGGSVTWVSVSMIVVMRSSQRQACIES